MIKKPLKIKCDDGLDARPIALLVQEQVSMKAACSLRSEAKRLMPRASWV